MSYLCSTEIGKVFLGSVELGKMYLGDNLVFQDGESPTPPTPAPTVNYLVYGNPTINGNIYIPDTTTKGFIYTNKPFNPGESEWVIQTKIKRHTAVAWKDIVASVNENGEAQYSIVCQTNTNSNNTGYGLNLSTNGSSWDLLANTPIGVMALDTWYRFQIVCTRSGNNYLYKMWYPDTPSSTLVSSKTSHPLFGKYISFGGGFSGVGTDCEIDLSETKIWVDGELWWEAITQDTSQSVLYARCGSGVLDSIIVYNGGNQSLTIYGPTPSGFSITDNGVDVTEDLVQNGNNYTYSLSNINEDHSLVLSSILSCSFSRSSSIFAGKNISIIGDSISTYNASPYKYDSYRMYYPKGDVTSVEYTWWKMLLNETSATLVNNLAYSGSSAGVRTDYPSYPSLYDRASLIGNCDLVIVALGTNDWPLDLGDYEYDTPIADLSVSEFRPAYIKGIKQIQATNPNARIVCIALYMKNTDRESIRTIAEHYELDFIDVGNEYQMIPDESPHPNRSAMIQIKNKLLSY